MTWGFGDVLPMAGLFILRASGLPFAYPGKRLRKGFRVRVTPSAPILYHSKYHEYIDPRLPPSWNSSVRMQTVLPPTSSPPSRRSLKIS